MPSPSRHAPPGYTQIRYRSTPITPAAATTAASPTYSHVPAYAYSPSSKDLPRVHRRAASYNPQTAYAYSPSPSPPYFTSPGYSSPGHYVPVTVTPLKQPDFGVSASKQHHHYQQPPPPPQPQQQHQPVQGKTRRTANHDGRKQRINPERTRYTTFTTTTTKTKEYSSRPTHAGRDSSDEDEGYYSPGKGRKGHSPPPSSYRNTRCYGDCGYQCTDCNPSPQVGSSRTHGKETHKSKSSSRPRAHSFNTTQKTTPTAHRPRANSNKAPSPPKATPADARRAHIPAGFSYKNWDPDEEPILLLGSVFDANSLGKWIYDWTVFHHGAATPMSDLAGELWLHLIQLAGKIKRAEEGVNNVVDPLEKDLVEEFLDSGERIWNRFGAILKGCEEYMWRAASREAKKKGGDAAAFMGANSGREFVESIFGRDRKLEETERLMTGMRLWSTRFDANCEEILRYPSG
ncbi:MAG: hypothetical protein Q9162_000171 [Coniocarpon cinnabarinum]